jgi:ABC-type glycerol-3-phosphate transport system permease component
LADPSARPWPRWSAAVRFAILAVAVLVSVLPLLIMLDTVIKPASGIAGTQHWIPSHPTGKYLASTLGGGQMWGWLRSSAIIAAGVTVLSLLLAVPASFALARRQFRGGKLFLNSVLVTQTMAPAVLIVPLFSLFRHLSLLNSYTGVILVSSAFVLPFSIWLLTAFFGQVSVEIEEAAALDRTTGLRFLLRFAVPMCLPGIVATAIWEFMYGWNEFMFSLTFLSGAQGKWPVTIGVFSSVGEYYVQWQPLMVTALVGVLPMFVLFLALRRWFEVGLSKTIAAGA